MKIRGITVVILLGLVLISATACGSDDKEMINQQSGDKETAATVTADGNLEALQLMELTFGSGGRIEEILVNEGDEVGKGDILARLDTGALELAVSQAKAARTKAEIDAARAGAGVTSAQAGLSQAQAALASAEIALELSRDVFSVSDIKIAETGVELAQSHLDETLLTLSKYEPGTPGYTKYQEVVLQAEARLKAANDTLNAMLNGYDVKEVAAKQLAVEAAEKSAELAGQNLKIAEDSLVLAEQSLELAGQTVAMAEKQLDEAAITAPFDGTIYRIDVKEGEFISPAAYAGTVVIGIVDLSRMELAARVDELDIAGVKTGQKATISIDALPEIKLEGEVVFISPVASAPDGVLLFEDDDEPKKYDVIIEVDIPAGTVIRSGMSATFTINVE